MENSKMSISIFFILQKVHENKYTVMF